MNHVRLRDLGTTRDDEATSHQSARRATSFRGDRDRGGLNSSAREVELKRHFDSAQIVEPTAIVTLENSRARFNSALEIPSDGFCMLPVEHLVRKLEASA